MRYGNGNYYKFNALAVSAGQTLSSQRRGTGMDQPIFPIRRFCPGRTVMREISSGPAQARSCVLTGFRENARRPSALLLSRLRNTPTIACLVRHHCKITGIMHSTNVLPKYGCKVNPLVQDPGFPKLSRKLWKPRRNTLRAPLPSTCPQHG